MNTEKENLEERIPVRCTAAQKEAIKVNAELCGLSMSEYLRRLGLGEQIQSKADLAAIGQLNRFGGLLKHLYSTSQGAHSIDTKQALDQVNQLLKKMLEAD
ncbi:plasmid mobilization protein [Oceanihabitans sediminis]|uniref:plasmid mobilization protein n=1 Tax=Oceanihabitans sediminis TaxID=1812012 RepID=UPI003A936CAA